MSVQTAQPNDKCPEVGGAKVYVGTSGWAYAAWKPEFYPPKLSSKKFLQHYAAHLNTVEVNYSFRHFLGEGTLTNWINDTPAGFAFSVKAHQAITHIRRLKNTEEPLRRFLESVQPLASAGRLGAVLFQLPPNLKADPVLLDEFLSQLPKAPVNPPPDGSLGSRLRAAFEFRHESWFQEPVYEALRHHDAALCLAESDDLTTPEIETASFRYYRFRRSEYTPEQRRDLATRLRNSSREKLVFAFLKHEERPESPLWAEEILKGIG